MDMSWMHQHFNMILLLKTFLTSSLYANIILCLNDSKLDITSIFKWVTALCIKEQRENISPMKL